MEADEQAEELDGCYPPGDRFLKIDQEPIVWKRADPCEHLDYISINELVSQNNLRLAEWYARVLASGHDIGVVDLRSVEECVKDARHAYYVAEHVRDCKDTAEPRNTQPGISFGERRKAQGIRNRAAYFAANSIIDLVEHMRDELLQIDSIEWLRSIRKPLPPPPIHPGTPVIPGEFTKFPILGPKASPKKKSPMATSVKTPVKQSQSKHKRNKASLESPGFHPESFVSHGNQPLTSNPPAQLTRSTSEAAGPGILTDPRLANPEFRFPALPQIDETVTGTTDSQKTAGSPKRYTTWADLSVNLPKSISVPQMIKTPMTPRQRRMLEDYRAKNPKKPYVSLAERERLADEQKVPNHVLLARSRTDGFSPKKIDTQSMPSLFTPKKERTQPAPTRKNLVGQASDLHYHGELTETGPSTPTRKSSKAELSTSTKKSSEAMQSKHSRQHSIESMHSTQKLDGRSSKNSIDGHDAQPEQDMGPPKLYTHKRNNGFSKSSPQPRDTQTKHSPNPIKVRTHTRKPSADSTKSKQVSQPKKSEESLHAIEKLKGRSSKGSFTYTHEHEEALVAGGFITPPPSIPEKSTFRSVHPLGRPQYDEHRLRRVESSRNLSPQKKKSADTIGRKEGHRIAKSVTTFNLIAAAAADSGGLPRSETVPGNLQEASAHVLDISDEPLLNFMEAVQISSIIKTSELGYRDTLQVKKDDDSKAKLPARLGKLKPIAEETGSPSKKKNKVVDSMQMFNSSFWNKDSASSHSKKDGPTSPKKDRAASPSKSKDGNKDKKRQTFEEKKPFLKAMWGNMSRKVHMSKPSTPIPSISISISGPTGLAPSSFMISCEPSFQASLYSKLELLLSTLANRFLMEEYNASRISRTQATNYVSRWVAMGRAQFTEFNCGQPFQAQIVWELREQLMFFGTYDQRFRDATLSVWQINAKEMAVKTGCIGDSAMQKHLQDSWKVLELLGGSWEDFEALSKLHISFHDMVAVAKKRNDSLGIPHEWNPEPVPKTPAVGALIRTPMLK